MARASRQPSRLANQLALHAAADGRSVRQLASAMGAPPTSVYHWRELNREMPLGAAESFAKALGLRLEVLRPNGRVAPCGHKVGLPTFDDTRVCCKVCGQVALWVLVEEQV